MELSLVSKNKKYVLLRKISKYEWGLFGPKGNMIGDTRCGALLKDALEWAKIFMSTWPDILIKVEERDE